MRDRRKDKDTRGEIEKLNALQDEIRSLSPRVHFYFKMKAAAIKQGIDKLIDYEDYI